MIHVIGGSGFIGSRLIGRLLDNYQVSILDIKESVFYPNIRSYVDVRTIKSLRETITNNSVIINLAAEHKDNIEPKSLYDDVNVKGAQNICQVAEEKNVKKIIFTSSVAVYGFAPIGTDENGEIKYFNDYGRTKWEAEQVFFKWVQKEKDRTLVILRPTVVFGERNRGNVYNLLNQIVSGKFMMVGNGKNIKSIAYVENVAAFIEYSLNMSSGTHIYNYIDKPDLTMNDFVRKVNKVINNKENIGFRIPNIIGYFGGFCFDCLSKILKKEFPISLIRVKKFISNTMFSTSIPIKTDFLAPIDINTALEKTIKYEFTSKNQGPVFYSE